MHALGCQQETSPRPAPSGWEIVWAVQEAPFQVIGWPPLSATQLSGLAHAKLPPEIGGVLSWVQVVPSKPKAKLVVSLSPSAMQNEVVLEQDTEFKSLGMPSSKPDGPGPFHALPVHTSVSSSGLCSRPSWVPMATHSDALAQDTGPKPQSSTPQPPKGMGTVCQAVPFHTALVMHPSWLPLVVWLLVPTAMQNAALTHDSPVVPFMTLGIRGAAVHLRPSHRWLVRPFRIMQNRALVQDREPPLGADTTRQVRPFHASASGPLASPPTAMQNEAPGQEIAPRLAWAGGITPGTKSDTRCPPAEPIPGAVRDEAIAGAATPRHARPAITAAVSSTRPARPIFVLIGHHIPSPLDGLAGQK